MLKPGWSGGHSDGGASWRSLSLTVGVTVLLLSLSSAGVTARTVAGIPRAVPSGPSNALAAGLGPAQSDSPDVVHARPSLTQPWTYSNVNYSLGLPGDSPAAVAFDALNEETFVAEFPDYLVAVAPSPGGVSATAIVGFMPSAIVVVPALAEVFVANSGSDNVSVLNASTLAIEAAIPVGSFPSALAFDAATDIVAVANEDSLNLSLVNASSWTNEATIATGLEAGALGYDPANGEIYVTGELASDGWPAVEWIDPGASSVSGTVQGIGGGSYIAYDPTDAFIMVDGGPVDCACFAPDAVSLLDSGNAASGAIVLPPTPEGLVYDSRIGEVVAVVWTSGWDGTDLVFPLLPADNSTSSPVAFTGECPGSVDFDAVDNLTLIANGCGTALTRLALASGAAIRIPVAGGGPDALLLDPSTGDLLVANEYSANLTVWSPSRDAPIGSVPVGAGPDALAFDSTTGDVYVANAGSNNVSVVSGSTYAPIGSVAVGGYPIGITFDSHDDEVWVANYESSSVTAISGATLSVVSTLVNQGAPLGLVYDSGRNAVFVADSANASLGEIHPDDLASFQWDFLPGTPAALAYDAASGEIDVGVVEAIVLSTSLHEVSARPAVLPSLLLRLTGDVVAISDTTGGIVASPQVGEFPYTVVSSPFVEECLAANFFDDNVSVLESGTLQPAATVSVGVAPAALVANGTTGVVDVGNFGSNSLTVLTPSRVLPTFSLVFSEAGLAAGNWTVALDGFDRTVAFNLSVSVSAVSGSYPYTISGPAGYIPEPGSGVAVVSGANMTVLVTFALPVQVEHFPVSFTEVGLCIGAWAVIFNQTLGQSPAGVAIVFEATNGTYNFSVPSLVGCRGTPALGTLTVAGAPVSQVVTYSTYPPLLAAHSSWSPELTLELLVIAAAVGIVGGVVALRSGRSPPRGSA